MKSFLLLILSLMITGWEVSSDECVKGCTDGWLEFTCKYPEPYIYSVALVKGNETIIPFIQKNVRKTKGRFSVYNDAANRNSKVVIKQLQHEDYGEYKCTFRLTQRSDSDKDVEVELKVDDGCQTPFIQTAYRTAKTTMSCDKRNSTVMFFCKEKGSICESILSTKSSLRSNGSYTLTETSSSFTMSISNVSPQHAGVYWCGVETDEVYRAALRKIQLKFKDTITNFTRSPTVGQNLTYWCTYPKGTPINKFICKGEDPSICEQIVSTAKSNAGKFSMMEDKKNRNITVTVRNVTTEDSGTYWCGAEGNDPKQSNPFFHKLVMTVGASSLPVTISVVVCVAVLLVLLIMVLVWKRFQRSKDTRNREQNNEDGVYEEIQERPQKPDSGTALNTIYVTANAPTNPSASQH